MPMPRRASDDEEEIRRANAESARDNDEELPEREIDTEDSSDDEGDTDGVSAEHDRAEVDLGRPTRLDKKRQRYERLEAELRSEREERMALQQRQMEFLASQQQMLGHVIQQQQPQQTQQEQRSQEDYEIDALQQDNMRLQTELERLPADQQQAKIAEYRSKYFENNKRITQAQLRKELKSAYPAIVRSLMPTQEQQVQAMRRAAYVAKYGDLIPRAQGGSAADDAIFHHWASLYNVRRAEAQARGETIDEDALNETTAAEIRRTYGTNRRQVASESSRNRSRMVGMPASGGQHGSPKGSRVSLSKEEMRLARAAYPKLAPEAAYKKVARSKVSSDDDD